MGKKEIGGGTTKALIPNNKKAQEMSTTTIILIVLGLIVLVILILGFRMGWNKVLPFLPSNNVQNIVSSCNTACATSSTYDFCTADRTLQADGLKDSEGKTIKEVKGNCNIFSKDPAYVNYGIEKCPAISCPQSS